MAAGAALRPLTRAFKRAGPGLRSERVRGSRGRTTRTNRVLDAVRRRVPHPTLSPGGGQSPREYSLAKHQTARGTLRAAAEFRNLGRVGRGERAGRAAAPAAMTRERIHATSEGVHRRRIEGVTPT